MKQTQHASPLFPAAVVGSSVAALLAANSGALTKASLWPNRSGSGWQSSSSIFARKPLSNA